MWSLQLAETFKLELYLYVSGNHAFPHFPASELQRAVSLLGTEQDTSQLRHSLWVTECPLELRYCCQAINSLLKHLLSTHSGNRKPSKATSWQRRLTDWWKRSLHFLSSPIRYEWAPCEPGDPSSVGFTPDSSNDSLWFGFLLSYRSCNKKGCENTSGWVQACIIRGSKAEKHLISACQVWPEYLITWWVVYHSKGRWLLL